MSEGSWFERADWSRRSAEFGGLRIHKSLVGMTFEPPGSSEISDRAYLWSLWCKLSHHPNILNALEHGLLRYAALDWSYQTSELDAARIATWGIEIVRAYQFLSFQVSPFELGWLVAPIVKIDLEGEIRLGFAVPTNNPHVTSALPPDMRDRWRCDEQGLVYVVGRALRDLVGSTNMVVDEIVQRCLEVSPLQRLSGLEAVRHALVAVGGKHIPALGLRSPRTEWFALEAGLGFLALGQPRKALPWFNNSHSRRARACLAEAKRRIAPVRDRGLSWTEAEPVARRLEDQRDLRGALEIYVHVRSEGADMVALETAIARCSFHLGNFGHAADYAERALRRDPARQDALAICVDALLRLRKHATALERADTWTATTPDEGRAHYARGKALLALGRFHEARDAFDRAQQLAPQLIEAMLLRREADRSAKGVAASVGTAVEMTLDIPARFSELRELLVRDRISDAIELLRQPDHARDVEAQMLLGQLLSFDGHFEQALEIFDGLGTIVAALLGKARALLALGRMEAALTVFEQLATDDPHLGEALEGREQVLRRLGRIAEADAAFAHYVAISAAD